MPGTAHDAVTAAPLHCTRLNLQHCILGRGTSLVLRTLWKWLRLLRFIKHDWLQPTDSGSD